MRISGKQTYIGTSGWNYAWKDFYPKGSAGGKKLEFYGGRFRAVEANYPFYRLPEKKTYRSWRGSVPDNFIFALKLSRYITHIKRLKIKPKYIRKYFAHAKELGGKLGPVLVQLPPSAKINAERLEDFLS